MEKSITPLIQAAFLGHANLVSVLIDKGAGVNKPEPCNGMIALHVAAEWGHREVAIYLDHGADMNARDKDGFTPLHAAAQTGHLPLVDLLILRGADLNLGSNQGVTPLILAAQKGHLEIVKLLVEKGAVVDQPANDGYLNVAKLLVNKGADIHQASNQGLTPFQVAALCGQNEVADYLMSKGATFEAVGTSVKVCKCCGAANATMKCAICLTVYYCSPECQKKDWKEGGENRHKIQCAALVEARYMEKAKREIEEKIARFGLRDIAGNNEGAGPSN